MEHEPLGASPLLHGPAWANSGRMSIAIIGAGLAGLTCATRLREAGREVRLFDKGRAPGGRIGTKRLEFDGRTLRLDHGAQYFNARDPGFEALLRDTGAQHWPDQERLVPVPGMSAFPRTMAEGLDIALTRHVTWLEPTGGGWLLHHLPAGEVRPDQPISAMEPDVDGPFEAVVITAPAPQAAELLAPHSAWMTELLGKVVYAPCWTWLATFAEPLPLPDTLRPEAGPIGWAARNSSKPGREPGESWVVQASPEWSREHLEDPAETVAAALREALGAPEPLAQATHRWRFSLVEQALDRPCVWDSQHGLGLAGDFCLAGRAEAAFISGRSLAEAILY